MKKLLLTTVSLGGLTLIIVLGFTFFRFKEVEDQIQVQIINEINSSLGIKSKIGSSSIHWLPYPSLVVNQIEASTDSLALNFPELQIFPDWKSIFYRQLAAAKIKLINPYILLKKFSGSETLIPNQFSGLNLLIENGTLETPKGESASNFALNRIKFLNINADLYLKNTRLKFDITANPSFCSNLSAEGRVDFKNQYYRINLNSEQLNLLNLVNSYTDKFVPLDHPVDLKVFMEGVTTNNFKIKINGELPPFTISRQKPFEIKPDKFSEIIIEKYDNDIFIKLADLNLVSPKILLDGSISKKHLKDIAEPIWGLDLSARDISLAQARDFVLSQWGDNEIAQIVCNIVQNGTANSSRYYFSGPLSDFEFIDKMEIEADVAEANIIIPDIELQIEQAQGKVAIIDGILSGKKLKAKKGTSIGSMGEILLDLRNDGDAFKLELDLDVDITALHEALETIVDNQLFQKELTHFADLHGRASGHLSLGDSLNDLNTTVKVRHVKGSGIYNRVPWPFSIKSGEIIVHPDQTDWSAIKASIGPHDIHNSSGTVSWKDKIKLKINSLIANIDSNDFFHNGYLKTDSNFYQLNGTLSDYLADINGLLSISKSSISGDISNPENWQYKVDFSSDNLAIISPSLPETINSNNISGQLSENSLTIFSDISLLGEKLETSLDLSHNNFTSWRGSTEFNGVINENTITWLERNYTLPSFPALQTPFRVDKLKVSSTNPSKDYFSVSGSILAGLSDTNPPTINVDINRRKNLFMSTIDVDHHTDYGKFVYNVWDTTPHKSLMTWQGTIKSDTLDYFFKKQPFENGNLSGVFSILNTNHQEELSFAGYLEASNIKLYDDETFPPLTISNLNISGNENKLDISHAHFFSEENDSITLKGTVSPVHNNLLIDLNIAAKKLSSITLHKTIQNLTGKSVFDSHTAEADNTDTKIITDDYKVYGNIDFTIEDFIYSLITQPQEHESTAPKVPEKSPSEALLPKQEDSQNNIAESQKKEFHWSPVKGQIGISDNEKLSIDFSEAKLCGIEMTGSYVADSDTSTSIIKLITPDHPDFQTTIPCLEFDTSVITGKFNLEANISGESADWKDGEFVLKSSGGIIHKMELLSNIFSVVNFTEFLIFNDLPDLKAEGLMYNDLIITGYIKDNSLIINKANLKGKGLNLTGQGAMNLKDMTGDFTVFVAPFKMLDSVITSIPLVGRIVGGKKGAILTFPVRVSGDMGNPTVTPLSPTAIGKAALTFIAETLTMPFAIFSPFVTDEEEKSPSVEEPEQIIEENLHSKESSL